MIGNKPISNWVLLVLLFSSAAVFMLLRTQDLYPRIFADEYTFSYHSKFFGEVESGIPSFLYYRVYNIVSSYGDDFLTYARYINIAFFMFGGLFVFLTGKSWLDERSNLLVTAAALFGPYSIYTHFFMPESMFYFGFWLFLYFFSRIETGNSTLTIWAAISLGMLSLVKPHAILILPACLIYIAIINMRIAPIIRQTGSFIVVVMATKLLVGYLLVGSDGLTLFGANYSSHASSVLENTEIILSLWSSIVANILSNLGAMFFLYGLTVPLLISGLSSDFKRAPNIQKLATLLLINLLIVVVAFTSTVPVFENNQDFRIYFRYYGFVFPLLFMNVFVFIDRNKLSKQAISTQLTFSMSIMFIGMILYFFVSRHNTLYPYNIFISDIPELFFIIKNEILFIGYGIISILTLIIVFLNTEKLKQYYGAYIASFTIVLAILSILATREDQIPSVSDKAGNYLSINLSPSAQDSLLVVGKTEYQLQNILFYSSSPRAKYFTLEPGDTLAASHIPTGYKYVLVLGDINHDLSFEQIDDGSGFRLYLIEDDE